MATIDHDIKCPNCGAGMVLRTASKGSFKGKQFYGCSRFPRCKGIQNQVIISKEQGAASGLATSALIHGPTKENITAKTKEAMATSSPLTEFQKKELRRLRDRLLNVSSRNRSIRLSRLDKKSAFDLSALNELGDSLVINLIEHCLKNSKDHPLLPQKISENEEIWNKISDRLTHLHRNISEIQRETGLHDLYIGFPFLAGKPTGAETVIQAPIFLIPVQLERLIPKKGAATWVVRPSQNAKVVFNKTLFYALAKLCNLTINQDLFEEEVPHELFGENHFIKLTQRLLEDYGVPANAHQNNSEKQFDKVQEFKLDELPIEYQVSGLKICQYAVLGHFPQSNSSIQKDYEKLLDMDQEALDGITCFLSEEYLDQDQEYDESLVGGSFNFDELSDNESGTIDIRPEKENFFLLPSDSSQDRILLELSKSSTDGLVVWGPPGTGKSQTIVNIIGECIAKGKTVLLVSQKRAALDVVFERLETRRMDSFVAIVHDTKEDRKDLYRKISKVCTQAPNNNVKSNDPSSEIDRITQTLKDVHVAFNDEKYGTKFGKIIQKLTSYKGPFLSELDHYWRTTNSERLEEIGQVLDSFQQLRFPNLKGPLIDQRKQFDDIDYDLQRIALSKLNSALSSEDLKYNIFINCLVTGTKSKLKENERCLIFKKDLEEYKADTSFFRFFKARHRKLKKLLNAQIATAQKALRAETLILRQHLDHFFNDALINEAIDLFHLPNQSLELLDQSRTFLENYFDTLKALDEYRKKLPKEVVTLESKLRELSSTDQVVKWGDILTASVYALWEADLENKYPSIALIRSGQIDKFRERLRELLDQKIDYCVEFMRERLSKALATPNGIHLIRALGSEVEKKRNILTIRKLNEKFLDNSIYKSVLPVWLVSPETVSDVFPLKKSAFDVVIFDEASQCTVENGLPAVFRGRQVVVAGDEKQLPPSRLFESTVEEENDEESVATLEPSLLTLAKKTVRYKPAMLEWHYRSKHQELVTFSNEVFYRGRMKIAPNVVPFVKGNKPSIHWHSVQGFWVNRTNEQEAARVIALIQSFLSEDQPKSIGIITFNINQKNLILDLIDKKLVEDPDFAALIERNRTLSLDQQLFVKNIENVQGDEREIIIFSVAYAPEHPSGRVKQHFGLLNQTGGENRLNVAITRAIREIHIVASINPETDLNTSTLAQDGPKIFQKYLCYAKAVSDENFEKVESILRELNPNLNIRAELTALHFDSSFEEDVYNELSSRGYELHSQVGQSGFRIDLAVVHPKDRGRYVLGIECDGAMYHSGVSVRERDVFRQRFLEDRGWSISRIWSPSWRKDRTKEIVKIINAIESGVSKKQKEAISKKDSSNVLKMIRREIAKPELKPQDFDGSSAAPQLAPYPTDSNDGMKRIEERFAASDHRMLTVFEDKLMEPSKELYASIINWNAKSKSMTTSHENMLLNAFEEVVYLKGRGMVVPHELLKRATLALQRAISLGFDPNNDY